MNDKQKELLEKLKATPLLAFQFAEAFRKLYNVMCEDCKNKIYGVNKGKISLKNFDISDLCDKCKNRYQWTAKDCDKIFRKIGGAVK